MSVRTIKPKRLKLNSPNLHSDNPSRYSPINIRSKGQSYKVQKAIEWPTWVMHSIECQASSLIYKQVIKKLIISQNRCPSESWRRHCQEVICDLSNSTTTMSQWPWVTFKIISALQTFLTLISRTTEHVLTRMHRISNVGYRFNCRNCSMSQACEASSNIPETVQDRGLVTTKY